MLHSYSVIVPVLNRSAELAATLHSILQSMAFFAGHHPRASEIAGEVVVVDEGSTDGTREIVREAAARDSRVRLVEHTRSFGIGPARNTGVRMAVGDVLFFCDGDDLFLPEHLFVGFSILDGCARSDDREVDAVRVRVGTRGHVVYSPKHPVAAVRTGVVLKDDIRPEWRTVIQWTIAQCLCVRRECHDWIEGFPEEYVYKQIGGCEDGAYTVRLETFFHVGVVDLETVEYIRRPGNSLDRQMLRFTHPPGSPFDMVRPSERDPHEIRSRVEQGKLEYLLDKWRTAGPPSLLQRFLNWPAIVGELIARGRMAEAAATAAQAQRHGVDLPGELTAAIAAAGHASVDGPAS